MKIGIITHHYVKNYGAFLQAYALKNIIEQMEPNCKIEFINLIVKKHYLLMFYRTFRPSFKLYHISTYPERIRKFKILSKFERTLPLSKPLLSEHLIKSYDKIIIGSDEVWNYLDLSYHPFKFAYRLYNDKVYTYAASVGQIMEDTAIPEIIIKGLKKIRMISVRDDMTNKFLHKAISKNGEMVLDPTLIYNFQNDRNISDKPIISLKYILIYGCVFSKKQISEISTYAKNNGLIVVGAGEYENWYNVKKISYTPFEWVNLFQFAELVLTGTFHGLMFSLSYQKNFICMPVYQNRINKTSTILSILGLEYCSLKKDYLIDDFTTMLNSKINYDMASKKLQEMIENSKNYLYRVLSD